MTQTHPLFSIVIPVYNRKEAFKRALLSCLSQTYQNFELIVVDDGSREDIASVVKEHADDSRIVYHRQDNQGAQAARNAGVRLARAPWIAYLDSDDYWLPNKLETFERVLRTAAGVPALSSANHLVAEPPTAEQMAR